MDYERLQVAIKQEAERLITEERMDPESAWLRAIETEYRKAQARQGAALVERTIWDTQMRWRREA